MKSEGMLFRALKQRRGAVMFVPVADRKAVCAKILPYDNDTYLRVLIGTAGANPMRADTWRLLAELFCSVV